MVNRSTRSLFQAGSSYCGRWGKCIFVFKSRHLAAGDPRKNIREVLPAARLRDLPPHSTGNLDPEADSHLHFGERLLFGLAERGTPQNLQDDDDEPHVLVAAKELDCICDISIAPIIAPTTRNLARSQGVEFDTTQHPSKCLLEIRDDLHLVPE
jgi:hypothetical protein